MLYVALAGALLYILFKGSTQMGAQRWITIGSFNLQPSEFARMVIALILAMYYGENRRGAKNTSDLIIGGMFTAVPLLMIAKQPDLGTAVTLLPVFFGVAYLAGLRMRLLAVIAIAGLLLSPDRLEVRGCRIIRNPASRCSSTPARIPRVRATRRSRRGSPSAPAGWSAKAS